MKLSKTGWNNVIIFAVMAFILLINATNKQGSPFADSAAQGAQQSTTLVAEQQLIVALTIDNVITIERVGRHWRASPEKISGQALTQMMRSWQHSTGELMTSAPMLDRQLSLDVQLEFAEQAQAVQLNFYATEQALIMFNQSTQQWQMMPLAMYGQLFPSEIFAN
ncbi:hypothetical protein SAMN05216262_11282 [Colwellia chukchiensis]|uniref:DUF4340 domain-containing protein n=1 Tax=Colwellia chukchiensis TaxID=641665 RepID=A0A1H7QTS5_9GAMM|nr:hypothetical protein [Colwellia chukchiensis]SEL50707.1 hypothetical protein SAMN05216262_11282 [Colwellia chukchiensis]